MSELTASIKDYLNTCQISMTESAILSNFHNMMIFDLDILSNNFTFFDIRTLLDQIYIDKEKYKKEMNKVQWKMVEVKKHTYMVVKVVNSKTDEKLKGKLIDIPNNTLIKCVHYAIPREEYAIYSYFDSIPEDWYPLPRQLLMIKGDK